MAKPAPFRPGQYARILIPKRVVRVGYPKTVADYWREVARQDYAVSRLLANLSPAKAVPTRAYKKVQNALAYAMAQADEFGGWKRELHFEEVPEFAGREAMVYGTRRAVTGTYSPGHQWSPDEAEGPRLKGSEHHVLVKLCLAPAGEFGYVDNYPEFPATYLEHVE